MDKRYYDYDAYVFTKDDVKLKKYPRKDYSNVNCVVVGSNVIKTNADPEETAKGLILAGIRYLEPRAASYALIKKIIELLYRYKKYDYTEVEQYDREQMDDIDAGMLIKNALVEQWMGAKLCDYTPDEFEEILFHAMIHVKENGEDGEIDAGQSAGNDAGRGA